MAADYIPESRILSIGARGGLLAPLESSLERSVGKAGASPWRQYVPWLAIAAVLLLSVIVWRVGRGSPAAMADDPAMQPLIASAVGDHRDCALRHQPSEAAVPLAAAASDAPALRGLDDAVGRSTAGLASPLAMLAAHACVWKGRRFGHIVLSFKDAIVSFS